MLGLLTLGTQATAAGISLGMTVGMALLPTGTNSRDLDAVDDDGDALVVQRTIEASPERDPPVRAGKGVVQLEDRPLYLQGEESSEFVRADVTAHLRRWA